MKNDESKAKCILEKIFPKRYNNLKKTESPDFLGIDVGLEITNAIEPNEKKFLEFFKNNVNKPITGAQIKKNKSNYKPLLFKINGQEVLGGYVTRAFTNKMAFLENVKKSLKAKLLKLNSNYKCFKQNDLCIIIDKEYEFNETIETGLEEEKNFCREQIKASIEEVYYSEDSHIKFDLIHVLFKNMIISVDTKSWDTKLNLIK